MTMLSELRWLGGWTFRSSAVIDREIDEELDFHITSRTQDLIASGMPPDEAAAEANRQFGQRETIRRQCQAIGYGDNRWLMFGFGVGLLSAVLSIGWLMSRLNQVQLQNQQILSQLQALQPVKEKKLDLTGEIIDAKNAPVAGAKVLLIFKSWPGGQYQQEDFQTTSDKDGKFNFPELYTTKTQTAFLVTILADNQTMQSEYVLYKANANVKPFRFQLKPAIDKTFILQTSDGKPLANKLVFPGTRKPANSEDQFLIYHQSAEAAGRKSDAKGKVRLPFFEAGDEIELSLADGKTIQVVVDQSAEQSLTVDAKAR